MLTNNQRLLLIDYVDSSYDIIGDDIKRKIQKILYKKEKLIFPPYLLACLLILESNSHDIGCAADRTKKDDLGLNRLINKIKKMLGVSCQKKN